MITLEERSRCKTRYNHLLGDCISRNFGRMVLARPVAGGGNVNPPHLN